MSAMPEILFYCLNAPEEQLIELLRERPELRVHQVFTLVATYDGDEEAIAELREQFKQRGIEITAIDKQDPTGTGRVARRVS